MTIADHQGIKDLLLGLTNGQTVITDLYTGHLPSQAAAAVIGMLRCAELRCRQNLCIVVYVLVQLMSVCKQLEI
jgi:hypothetical protein